MILLQKMLPAKAALYCFVFIAILCLLAVAAPALAASQPRQPHVLILNSYHYGYLWSDGEQAGIIETIRAHYPEAQLHIEYLDTKNFPQPAHYRHVFENFAYKYQDVKFSVIIAADNAALEFLAEFGQPLFGDTPLVFCGVSNFSPALLKDLHNITGIVERHDVRSTIATMLRLHPATHEIYVVVDNTLTGKELRQVTEAVLPDLQGRVKLTFTDNIAVAEVLRQIRQLPADALVLILTFARDSEGQILDLPELARMVSDNSPVPVYVIQKERLGVGVVGGYLLGGKDHGIQAAQLALRILAGEAVAAIPIVSEPLVRPMFDFVQLKKFGINKAALPAGSVVINEPESILVAHRQMVWSVLGFVLFLVCAIGVLLSNIRKRMLAEDTLRQNRAMLRQIIDTIPQAIFWKDRESIYLGCNALFAKDAGVQEPEQIRGKTDFDLPWPRVEAEAYRADDLEVITTNQVKRHIVEPLQQADGARLWIDTCKAPLLDSQGKVYGVLGVYADITERKQLEEQLFLMLSSINAAQDSIFLIDEKARFHFVNDGACRRLGYSREELLGLGVFDLDPDYPAEKWPEHWQQLMEHGSLIVKTMHRTKSGESFPVEVSANRVIYGDKAYNCAFARDISERQNAEEEHQRLEMQLRQSQKIEAMGTLAGGIAHDFNNILSVIFGYTELAMVDDDPAKHRQDLAQVLKGAFRAKELVQQILAFSRKTEQRKQPLQISLIVKEALKMMRASIPSTIEIRQNINSDGTVLADPSQIHQIIMNLCTNAYHAMRESGGTMTVSLDEVELGPEEYGYADLGAGRYMKLDVSDTGCGIDPQIKDKIFEPYFTTKKQGEGTGLGLAVVYGIVKSHNGHISVYSEVGQGTIVHVYLPLSEKVAVPMPDKMVAKNLTGNGERILFVDDEEQICDYVGVTLRGHGYEVAVFSDAVQAWEAFAKQPERFDLVITDMTMPHMTGAALAQKVLAIRPDLPVILCSGHSALIDRQQALHMGIREYLSKPVAHHELLAVIHQTLAKR